jgi:hypothetical protein
LTHIRASGANTPAKSDRKAPGHQTHRRVLSA